LPSSTAGSLPAAERILGEVEESAELAADREALHDYDGLSERYQRSSLGARQYCG
jgi:hypothetical protein